jgi:hypothetical protein
MNENETATSTPTSRLRRMVMALTVAAASATLALVPATAAHAQITYSAGSVRTIATCYSVEHKVNFATDISLSPTRFPSGAYVALRYKYWYTDLYGRAISPAYASNWSAATWTQPSSRVINGIRYSGLWSGLPGWTRYTSGVLRTAVKVAVWNGSAYEYSVWAAADGYENYGQWNEQTSDGVCLASIT